LKRKAIAMKPSPTNGSLTDAGLSRRGALAGAAACALGFVAGASARAFEFDGGLAPLEAKTAPADRATRILPPGSDNAKSFARLCNGCQLCVSVCPNQALRPSESLSTFMQPYISYERGYCRPECVKCSEVCPTGAIRPITTAEKSATQIGVAKWDKGLCIVNRDNATCDLCSRKCPAGAIAMIPQSAGDMASPMIPMIDANRCIGCGACEHLCPSRPNSAIFVDGVEAHRMV
ncbi:MAG: 4Fe-4S dicluster domain-containing protein, partial [Chitinispirillales bacterium]|jgi:ferredoxin|nr:4Fe-4S dicluster domain-containing protein [Chitinispirillales bacterium]